jgi:hypothetical protein
MKTFFFVAFFLLLAASRAEAQKTCVKNPNVLSQTCTVTIQWPASIVDATHDAPQIYTPRRSDSGSSKTPLGNVAPNILSFQNVFTDTGGITHCWDVTATNAGGTSGPSPEACWTTPALQKGPPNAPPNTTLSNNPLANGET